MKKLSLILCVLLLGWTAVSCANPLDAFLVPEKTEDSFATEQNALLCDIAPDGASRILVVCFSRVGVTRFPENVDAISSASLRREDGVLVGNNQVTAKILHKEIGGDLFQIGTQERYPAKYTSTKDQAREELEAKVRPALSTHVENMAQYDTVFLCYPNWHGSLPMPVCTFLEEYDWSGKTIAPLCTHGGAAAGDTAKEIAEFCPGATVLQVLSVSADDVNNSASQIRGWLNLIGLNRSDAAQ